ncbi:MAG: preprotein translocase subunit SecY [Crocinitomicaceae bacterium]|nr:preprotein translocase subunit SecY [Crocinitomicaceae bacterium]
MKGFIQKIKNIWNHEDLRKRIGYTLLLLLVYRIGSFIVIPGVDSAQLQSGNVGGLAGFLGLFTGGAFNRAAIFALGVMPYISASIIIQLLGLAVPTVQKMQREGESGRKRINQWTRFLTIAIGLVQAPGYITQYIPREAHPQTPFWLAGAVIILTCSTLFIMWLGERITEKGIGNGVSLIIMIGIISDIPNGFSSEASSQTAFFFLIEFATLIVIIGLCVAVVQAVRRIPVQMARHNSGGGHLPSGDGARSFIPLKVNSAGVMPIIFAQAIMFAPLYLQNIESLRDSPVIASLSNIQGWGYNILLFSMIIIFTFFYTAIVTNPNQIADDLKRNGNFVPGVKPGKDTAEFIDRVLSNITLPGGIFVGIIAILPAVIMISGLSKTQQFAQFFGGTSLLITVGVILDLLQQIESYLLSRHYDGLMKSGRMRGRNAQAVSSGITG